MAIDRNESLRRAEKLLRQGRLDGAVEEYERLLEEQPHDWNTRNILGDLYVRAGQIDQAVAHFTRIGDHFAQEGFLSRASALYKKVVKIKPDDEHALLQSSEIAARQGLLVDAKACLAAIAVQRRRRSDVKGTAEILLRITVLDPADLTARVAAARATADAGDAAGAATRYKEVAVELFARQRGDDAVEALTEALALQPIDDETRDRLVRAQLGRGDIESARRHATTTGHLKAIADELAARGRDDEALDMLFDVVERDAGDVGTRARLARSLIARGEIERAAACVDADGLAGDPELLLLSAEVHLRTGRTEAARDLLKAALDRDAGRRDDVVALGTRLVDSNPHAAFECVDIATDAAIADRDWPAAVTALHDYVLRVPAHVPALMKLVDVCVDSGMEGPLCEAQAALADTYLDAGRAQEARFIAEDLFVRAPTDPACVERFRRALQMVGEADPDAVIADRLSVQAAIGDDDLDFESPMPDEAPAAITEPEAPADEVRVEIVPAADPLGVRTVDEPFTIEEPEPVAAPLRAATPAPSAARPSPAGAPREPLVRGEDQSVYDLSSGAIDLSGIFGDDEPEHESPGGEGDMLEIDLSGALTGLTPEQSPPQAAVTPPAPATDADAGGRDLDAVFAEFREEVLREHATSAAAQHYKVALTYRDMGMPDEAIKALETAVRAPKYRFLAASLLGRIHGQQGRTHQAIDWFERAAETPAPGIDAGRALLYELGRALEDAGEEVRALAVYLELQADAGRYRDVTARISRLSQQHSGD